MDHLARPHQACGERGGNQASLQPDPGVRALALLVLGEADQMCELPERSSIFLRVRVRVRIERDIGEEVQLQGRCLGLIFRGG